MQHILVLNGPNLNLLGTRQPELYGDASLAQVNAKLALQAQQANFRLTCKQTNAEHELITLIHAAKEQGSQAMILNVGALAHTSVAIRDALLAVDIPFVEVHISNTYAREHFRQHSYLSDIAAGVIVGLGALGYELALTAIITMFSKHNLRETCNGYS